METTEEFQVYCSCHGPLTTVGSVEMARAFQFNVTGTVHTFIRKRVITFGDWEEVE